MKMSFNISIAGATYRTYSYYGWPNASLPIFLDQLQCFGNESTILGCPRPYAIGVAYCNYNALAGVVCPSKKNDSTKIRI